VQKANDRFREEKIVSNNKYNVLISNALQHPNWETDKAKKMFEHFISDRFSYDAISNYPDYLSYASAELLHDILPQMIEEMIKRKDTDNFLIYKIISALDPLGNNAIPEYQERAIKLVALADKKFSKQALQFLEAIRPFFFVPGTGGWSSRASTSRTGI